MKRIFLLLGVWFLILGSEIVWGIELEPASAQRSHSPAVAAKPAPPPPATDEDIAGWIKDLGSRDFKTREDATKKLAAAGRPAIPKLVKAAESGHLEVTVRAIRVLESIYTSGSMADFEAAESALEGLGQAESQSVASRAKNVLSSMSEVREQHAIAQIEQLGGIVKSDPRVSGLVPNNLGGRDVMTTVILNKRWKGDVQDLALLEKLRFLQTLYLVEGVVPPMEVAKLEQNLPNIRVQLRGGACLGVGGLDAAGGCRITLINPGSAAAKAGLRAGDLIVAFNGKRGEKPAEDMGFDRLVELIKEHDAGDKVPLQILRNGRELTVPVVLDEWK